MSKLTSRGLAVVAAGLLLLAACGKEGELKGPVVKDASPCSATTAPGSKPADPGEVAKPPKTTKFKDVKAGKGCTIDSATFVAVEYTGAVAATGKVFATTWTDKKPLEFRLGNNEVIQGWETGLAGMKVGGRRTLTVPAKEAYGKDGLASEGIGKDEALTFVVDLVGVTSAPRYCRPVSEYASAPGKPSPSDVEAPADQPEKLTTRDIKEGTGTTVTKKMYITVNYIGILCRTGAQFESSWDSGDPIKVALSGVTPTADYSTVIDGWNQGVVGMKVGGIRQIDVPADLAYGATGNGNIGPNEGLIFVIQVDAASTKAPKETTTTTAASGSTTTTAPAEGSTTTTAAEGSSTTTSTTEAKGSTTTTTAAKG